jgi:isoleucyl-tRNA synthetase
MKTIKANYKVLGPKLGNLMKETAEKIEAFTQEDIAQLEKDKYYVIYIRGINVNIGLGDVMIE